MRKDYSTKVTNFFWIKEKNELLIDQVLNNVKISTDDDMNIYVCTIFLQTIKYLILFILYCIVYLHNDKLVKN